MNAVTRMSNSLGGRHIRVLRIPTIKRVHELKKSGIPLIGTMKTKWNPVLGSHQRLRLCRPPPELLGQRDNKSNFNDQRRIKIFAELVWVAPLISQYAG